MPPFGKRWFRILRELEHDHPIALLRAYWIQLNIVEDQRLNLELRKQEIEYGGFWANPEFYDAVKGAGPKDFKVIADTPDFDRRIEMAKRGEDIPVGERRASLAALVQRKRAEKLAEKAAKREAAFNRNPAIVDVDVDEYGDELPATLGSSDDDLIVED